jgi:hypothetical protein
MSRHGRRSAIGSAGRGTWTPPIPHKREMRVQSDLIFSILNMK